MALSWIHDDSSSCICALSYEHHQRAPSHSILNIWIDGEKRRLHFTCLASSSKIGRPRLSLSLFFFPDFPMSISLKYPQYRVVSIPSLIHITLTWMQMITWILTQQDDHWAWDIYKRIFEDKFVLSLDRVVVSVRHFGSLIFHWFWSESSDRASPRYRHFYSYGVRENSESRKRVTWRAPTDLFYATRSIKTSRTNIEPYLPLMMMPGFWIEERILERHLHSIFLWWNMRVL